MGFNAISIVNFCDAGNDRDLPCPAPAGTVDVPWQPNPAELALPGGAIAERSPSSPGRTSTWPAATPAAGASADVLVTTVSADGNLDQWAAGPALPGTALRRRAGTLSGVPYVIGGLDASESRPRPVFAGVLKEGELTGWTKLDGSTTGAANLTLPAAISDAAAVAASNGIYVFGGRTADGAQPDGAAQQARHAIAAGPGAVAGGQRPAAAGGPRQRHGHARRQLPVPGRG